ncbi:MAG TPA: HAMP domain-containing sensor histidine kinase [Longimicrobiales bacterium]
MRPETLVATPLQVAANRLDLISRLADDLAHEVKNPLHSMTINLELLRRRISTGQQGVALDRVRVLDEDVSRLNQLLECLFQLLRPGPPDPETFELDAAVQDLLPLIETVGRLAGVVATGVPAGSGAIISMRRPAFRHAILNVVENALTALRPRGGHLVLLGSIAHDEVQLRIRDTGPGVPAEAVLRLGTPGFSTWPDHAGLGLAVARALLEEAGGRIEFEPPGDHAGGSTFLLAWPRATSA